MKYCQRRQLPQLQANLAQRQARRTTAAAQLVSYRRAAPAPLPSLKLHIDETSAEHVRLSRHVYLPISLELIKSLRYFKAKTKCEVYFYALFAPFALSQTGKQAQQRLRERERVAERAALCKCLLTKFLCYPHQNGTVGGGGRKKQKCWPWARVVCGPVECQASQLIAANCELQMALQIQAAISYVSIFQYANKNHKNK